MTENWNNEKVCYNSRLGAMYFESELGYENAVYVIDIPEGAKAFSLSMKAGNSYPEQKEGYEDVGYFTVGTDDGVTAIEWVRSSPISMNTEFSLYTLGDAENPVNINEDIKQLFIRAECHNSTLSEGMDFYFGEPEVQFYFTSTGTTSFEDLLSFNIIPTDEKVKPDIWGGFKVLLVLLIIAAGGAAKYIYDKKKAEGDY